MIKVELNVEPVKAEPKPFPKLMIRKDSQDYTIILAAGVQNNRINGVVIDSSIDSKIGLHSDVFNAKIFTDYNEPITLQNI